MEVLLTNDDGIDAEGLQCLAKAMESIADVTVVAPKDPSSSCSHHVTVATAISLERNNRDHYIVGGFPADCVRIAIQHLGLRPDWIISGINHGGNLGTDTVLSGTVAAARESSLFGIPSIAVSQYRRPNCETSWTKSAQRFIDVFQSDAFGDMRGTETLQTASKRGVWNVNLPALPDSESCPSPVLCSPEPSILPFQYKSTPDGLRYECVYQQRGQADASDVAICFGGAPSISWLSTQP
jgi:5'-nucleotidase